MHPKPLDRARPVSCVTNDTQEKIRHRNRWTSFDCLVTLGAKIRGYQPRAFYPPSRHRILGGGSRKACLLLRVSFLVGFLKGKPKGYKGQGSQQGQHKGGQKGYPLKGHPVFKGKPASPTKKGRPLQKKRRPLHILVRASPKTRKTPTKRGTLCLKGRQPFLFRGVP